MVNDEWVLIVPKRISHLFEHMKKRELGRVDFGLNLALKKSQLRHSPGSMQEMVSLLHFLRLEQFYLFWKWDQSRYGKHPVTHWPAPSKKPDLAVSSLAHGQLAHLPCFVHAGYSSLLPHRTPKEICTPMRPACRERLEVSTSPLPYLARRKILRCVSSQSCLIHFLLCHPK
jgi:hypothetical protein